MTSLDTLYQVAKAIPELAWIARAGRIQALAECSPSEQERLDSLGSAEGILLFLPPSQTAVDTERAKGRRRGKRRALTDGRTGEQLLLGTSALQILSESSSPACSCLLLSALPPPFLLQSLTKLPSSASAHLDGGTCETGRHCLRS